jgi:heme oxygenase
MTLPDKLRQAIGQLHTSIEATPLATAMIGGTITREQYGFWLTQMFHLHSAVEDLLAASVGLAAIYDPRTMTRSDALRRDAAALDLDLSDPPCAAVETLICALSQTTSVPPWNLVGVLYVLEGSRMGSLALARPVARALGVDPRPGAGLDYHVEGAADRPRTWQAFRAKLAALPLSTGDEADVIAAAVVTMRQLAEVYSMEVAVAVGA